MTSKQNGYGNGNGYGTGAVARYETPVLAGESIVLHNCEHST